MRMLLPLFHECKGISYMLWKLFHKDGLWYRPLPIPLPANAGFDTGTAGIGGNQWVARKCG